MEAFGILLPLGVGVAFSSVPIMAVLVILLSERGRTSGLAYLIGYAIGLAGVTVAFTAGIRAIPERVDVPQPATGIAEIVLGVGCMVFAIWSFVIARRRGPEAEPRMPAWLRRLGTLGPIPAFGVGVILNLRPKALVLLAAAALAINSGAVTPVTWTIETAVFLALGISTIAVPVILVRRDGPRARAALERARDWIERNSYIVSSVVVVMVGVVLVGSGLSGL
ncbi:GAP family protein [Protaetiibacter larvae]|uniref:GAP family protein n=1 Tax=Protaetiibacter larvae TaxID=2592654 RepID=A0A5C1YCY0_9MICO|nr:GAP family protein [Protaetiibacter larvae]QEO10672.1 hypothetical protein FLP23_12045 [Protaetiibacter larvae]